MLDRYRREITTSKKEQLYDIRRGGGGIGGVSELVKMGIKERDAIFVVPRVCVWM